MGQAEDSGDYSMRHVKRITVSDLMPITTIATDKK
jgi:hypothetical protein